MRDQLGDRLTQMERWLEQCAPLFEQAATEPSIAAEEQFLVAFDQYLQFSWEVKLAELLNSL